MFRHALVLATAVPWVLGLPVSAGEESPLNAEDRSFFEAKIRPLLSSHCYECHSEKAGKSKGGLLLDRRAGWEAGGDSGGSVIDLNNPQRSLMIRMVHHDPDFEAMPPKSKLSNDEIASLEEWIVRGAPDPRDEEIGEAVAVSDFDLEARSDWWSLQPLIESSAPDVRDESWPINDYDRFILSRLEEKAWKPAEGADKATLLRRVSLALTGLAPTPEELEAFLMDDSEDAYERQVDRLLDSPHYGERFARHWMDVVRYADSKAFEQDYTIPYGNEYRDYLIRAFNRDIPYDQFVREAFAGDLLESPRIDPATGINESVIGPGFLLSTDGQHGPPDLHVDEARVFDGMINTATVAFQGLTVACAKCHDHKFDAITAADYYSFYGMLRSSRLHYANIRSLSVRHEEVLEKLKAHQSRVVSAVLEGAVGQGGELVEVIGSAVDLGDDPELKKLLEKARRDAKALQELRSSVVAKASREIGPETGREVANWFLFLWLDEDIPELNGLRRALVGKASRWGRSSKPPYVMDRRFKWTIQGRGFEWVDEPAFTVDLDHPSIIRSGSSHGAASGLKAPRLDGVLRSEDFILDGKPIELWVRGREAAVNLIVRNYEMTGMGPTTGVLRFNVDSSRMTRVSIPTELWQGEPAYLEVLHHGREMQCVSPKQEVTQPSDRAHVALLGKVDFGFFDNYWIDRDPQLIAEGIVDLVAGAASSQIDGHEADLVGALFGEGLVRVDPLVGELEGLLDGLRRLHEKLPQPRYVRSLVDGTHYDEPVYVRGSHKQPSKEPNPKHYLDVFGGSRIGKGKSGRLEYAEHLLTTSDFLTARVRVNRIWSRIFGNGLVSSVDDFGKMGEKPSHPELLDFMARRFIDEGWSTKRLIRDLVTSRTYRMVSVPGAGVRDEDPKNLFLQHMAVQRMDAESLRDHILQVSGELKRDLYGECIDVNTDDQLPSRAMPRNGPLDGAGRRSIYQTMRRSYLPSFQRAFNLPDPSAPVGQRQQTNVPAQSLTLMNHRFVHQQAEAWAKSLMLVPGVEVRIERLHLQAFSRSATDEEMAWAKEVLEEFREEGREVVAWKALCHLMINRKEFLYVF
ncbi:PSD1 and planctomycete cytochrome C domain-containing protein [Haloferula sp.]|uniref:PSD1 and planctomycete cytochrome C domain-containing protein n=1 Tax=Haloferula sp. TaxID=2497595 RepID=UPI003C745A50